MGKRALSSDELLLDILGAAERHGAVSEPDHEVGDLQDALRLAWALLTDAQRLDLHTRHFADHEPWNE